MRGLARWFLGIIALSILAVAAVAFVRPSWNDRADDVCRQQAPGSASGYSINWEWTEFAYVCDYRVPGEHTTRRVGLTEAFPRLRR